MKQYQIWQEGYAITGSSAPAKLLGTVEAETFNEACEKHWDAYIFATNKIVKDEAAVKCRIMQYYRDRGFRCEAK